MWPWQGCSFENYNSLNIAEIQNKVKTSNCNKEMYRQLTVDRKLVSIGGEGSPILIKR